MTVRIIGRLDIKGGNLVKGVNLEGLRVLGKPWEFSKYYSDKGVDELIYMDSVASLYGRNSLLDIIERTASDIFVPITVGGGIKSIDDVDRAMRAGADKVAINTAAMRQPSLIDILAGRYGSSTIVGSIQAQLTGVGAYECYIDNGRQSTGREVVSWARELVCRGVGEILLTAVHADGTGSGFDIDLIKMVNEAVDVPVIACGGAGSAEHVLQVIRDAGVEAVALASMLHYQALAEFAFASEGYNEGNTSFLSSGNSNYLSNTICITQLKDELMAEGIFCRQPFPAPSPL